MPIPKALASVPSDQKIAFSNLVALHLDESTDVIEFIPQLEELCSDVCYLNPVVFNVAELEPSILAQEIESTDGLFVDVLEEEFFFL